MPLTGEVAWEVLEAQFGRLGDELRCRFLLALPLVTTAQGGSGYAEVVVSCRDAWFVPASEGEV
ncbi:hypothetical protein K7W42_13920 [Deinococcus sp. HMF7604]|uniref:hypothetical protein n=1 Tax=Deinococcus betulae TaxID=2873312 RepID=UPI001CCC267D|nr:hypothetical protein [Deinococcus betulae]MBZ9751953.1 hypothetical protein [Deinococcus betulae]